MINEAELKNGIYNLVCELFCPALHDALKVIHPNRPKIEKERLEMFENQLAINLKDFSQALGSYLFQQMLTIEFKGTMAQIVTVGSPTTQTAQPVMLETNQVTMGVSSKPNTISIYQVSQTDPNTD